MKAIVFDKFGGPDVFDFRDVADPQITSDEVLIRVHAVTVNRTLDIQVRAGIGSYAQKVSFPHVPGLDPSGEVVAVGDNVDTIAVGDRVATIAAIRCGSCDRCLGGEEDLCPNSRHVGVHRWGGYAELCAVPAKNVVPIPDSVDFDQASVIVRHGPTANKLLRSSGLQSGETVLIMGAAGALGSIGVQLASSLGATVIAGAGADERVDLATSLGAHHGINYRTSDLYDSVMEATSGRGVDVVYENVGDPELFPETIKCLAYNGRLVTAGSHASDWVRLELHRLYRRRLHLIGVAGSSPEDIDAVLKAGSEGRLRGVIGRKLPLSAAAEGHQLIEDGFASGKLVFDVAHVDNA